MENLIYHIFNHKNNITMPHKIIKFGGSNLQKKNDFSRCAEIVEKYNSPCVIVVSAFYQVTDRLKKAALKASDSGQFPDAFLREFSDECHEQVKENVQGDKLIEKTNAELQSLLDKLSLLFRGIHAIGELPQTINDTYLVTVKGSVP
jgi:bifunctional aspartokinase / homoserine dehydrogenase 1